ncbi:hypothetical protein [Halorussus pelagicus]|uniref:hypothetical protein n=1 Tax=Halorussus pelagicus TaxID=2505977 RepID=UPI000FFC4535|nr:hypothetical protein [Halorussus pelagicus]
MATDDADEKRSENRRVPDQNRTLDTYANGGRAPIPRTRQQAENADVRRAGENTRRYGSQPNDPTPNRRYGSRPPSGREPPQSGDSPSHSRGRNGQTGRDSSANESPGQADSGPERSPSGTENSTRAPEEHPRGPEEPARARAESERPHAESQDERPASEETPPKRTQPLPESSESPATSVEGGERGERADSDRTASDADEGETPKYGGLWDPDWEASQSGPTERDDRPTEREQSWRAYERRFDRERDRQRDFQRDKSGDKYRRK